VKKRMKCEKCGKEYEIYTTHHYYCKECEEEIKKLLKVIQ